MIQFTEFSEGEKVILDKDYGNSSVVKVVRQTKPNRVYTTVRGEFGGTWDVMTNRLTRREAK